MIQSVEKKYDRDNVSFVYKITMADNKVMFVPHNEANRHYQEILEWVADGNTITDNGGAE
jgi:translation initiation factor 2 gamma subunit (eIF-2gamma)